MDLFTLCDGEISVLRGDTTLHYTVSHCGSTTLLNQAPHAQRARLVWSAGWGCSLLEMATTVTTASTEEGPLSFMEAWDSSFFFASALLLLTTLAFVVNLVPTLDSGLEEYWQ